MMDKALQLQLQAFRPSGGKPRKENIDIGGRGKLEAGFRTFGPETIRELWNLDPSQLEHLKSWFYF